MLDDVQAALLLDLAGPAARAIVLPLGSAVGAGRRAAIRRAPDGRDPPPGASMRDRVNLHLNRGEARHALCRRLNP